MKIFRRILTLGLALCLIALFVAVGGRIFLAEHYPGESTKMVFTPALTDYYRETDDFHAYTQALRTPYDDAKKGNFFAKGLIVVPEGQNLQITLRYNESALANVAAFYGLAQTPTPQENMFRFRLYVSYGEKDGAAVYKTYESSYSAETERFFYHYIKLAFDGVDFENAVWMRVDIYYGGEEKCFGSVPVYESGADVSGQHVAYPLKEYRVPREVLPQ